MLDLSTIDMKLINSSSVSDFPRVEAKFVTSMLMFLFPIPLQYLLFYFSKKSSKVFQYVNIASFFL